MAHKQFYSQFIQPTGLRNQDWDILWGYAKTCHPAVKLQGSRKRCIRPLR
jgi:hypothetical protein